MTSSFISSVQILAKIAQGYQLCERPLLYYNWPMSCVATPFRSISRLLPLLAAILCWRIPATLADQAAAAVETQTGSGPRINEIMAANVSAIVDPEFGAFADWVEIFNPDEEAIDLGEFTLTDDIRNPVKWSIPPGTILPAGGYILFWADGRDSGRHSNFRLSRDGEEVAFYDPDGHLVDMVRFGYQAEDVSYGRVADGVSDWSFFQQPTPGRMNEGVTVTGATQVPAPVFSRAGGRYETPIELTLSSLSSAAEIRYTLDGSKPTADSSRAHPNCRNGRC